MFSIQHALSFLGQNPIISSNVDEISQAEALVLPGVGSFKEAMTSLQNLGLINGLKETISKGKPLLGICLGFQLLFTRSEEFGDHKGLDIIEGTIKKFEPTQSLRVPHIGWNKLKSCNDETWGIHHSQH